MSAQISPTLISVQGTGRRTAPPTVLIWLETVRSKRFSAQCSVSVLATFVFAATVTFAGLNLFETSHSALALEILARTGTIHALGSFAPPPSDPVKRASSRPPKILQATPEGQKQHALPGYEGTAPPFSAHTTSTGELVQTTNLPEISFDTNQISDVLPWSSSATAPVFSPARTGSSKQIDEPQYEPLSEPERERVANSKRALELGATRDLAYAQPRRQAKESLLPKSPGSMNPYAYIAPRPLKQIMPNSKVYGVSVIRAPVEIEVVVKISEKGSVIDAFVPPSRNNGSRSPLTFPAIAAAKQWIFQAARMHGKNIPSDYSIRFAFRPELQ